MKNLFLNIAILFLVTGVFAKSISLASNQKIIFADSVNTSLEGSWQLQPVLPSDTAAGKLPVLNFYLSTNKFSGNTGCNNISGHFRLKGDSLIFIEQIMMTKMDCAGYNEKVFIENLTRTNQYKIENNTLQLMTDKTVISTWIRKGTDKNQNKI